MLNIIVTLDRKKNGRNKNSGHGSLPTPTLTEEIVLFNEEEDKSGSNYSEATLVSLIK